MGRSLVIFALLMALCDASFNSRAHADAVIARASAIIGRYECVVLDSSHKTWHFQSSNSTWGAWVRAQIFYPAQNGSPADITNTFVGFDETAKRWDIIALDRSGSYYTRSSTSAALNGSRWIDVYPADGGRSVIRVSPNGYTFDLTMPQSKASAHWHVTCTRSEDQSVE